METEKNNKKVTFNDELSVKTILNTLSVNFKSDDEQVDNNIDNNNILSILNQILDNQSKIIKLISEK